jgi:ATP-binding cassette subfamily C protein CydC
MKLWRELRPLLVVFAQARRRWLLGGALLAALTVLSGLALLGLAGWFITATAIAGLSAATAFTFDVFMPSAGIRLLALGRTASRYGERLVTHDATLGVLAQLRERLFRGWAQPEAARRLLARPAQLLFRLTADNDALDSLYQRVLVPASAALLAALATGLALGLAHWGLGVAVALWLVAAGLGIAWVVAQRARRAARRRAYGLEALRARSVDLVAGQTDLVMAGQLDAQRGALAAADGYLARADNALNRLETRAALAYSVAGTIALSATLLAVGALTGAGTMGAPVAALALLLVLTATEPFAALSRGALELGRTLLAARRLVPRMQTPGPQPATEGGAMVPAPGLALQLICVTANPGGDEAPGRPLLRELSLALRAGEHVALIGSSGAGKSTLLALVAGELAPHSGVVQTQPHSLLTQRTELFQDSLCDNLRLADPDADDARLWQVLEAAGLADDVRALPQTLDARLGEGGLGLSGGQARRLALARLLLRRVPLWLLDEPTEGLDPATARDVLQRLKDQASGRTVLLATHVRREAALADRLLGLQHGRIVADARRGEAQFEAMLGTLRPD